MEQNDRPEGMPHEKHENSSETDRSSPPRTALSEMKKVPLVTDTINKVSSIHGKLGHFIPLYNFITTFVLQSVSWTLTKIEGFGVVQWTVDLCDCIFLGIIDFTRTSFPVISLPTRELFGKLYTYTRKKTSAIARKVASYSLSQKMCQIMESALMKLETFGSFFTVDEDSRVNIPWWYAPNLCFAAYDCSVNSAMKFGVRHMSNFRHGVRNLRVKGAQVLAKSDHLSHRYKASPSRSYKRAQPWIGFRFLTWMKNKFYLMIGLPIDVSSGLSCDSSFDDTPNNEIASQEKKRKLSDVEEEDTCDGSDRNEETTYQVLMGSLSSYDSRDDPDYVPTEPSTDSFEYRVSSEEDSLETSTLGSSNEVILLTNGTGKHSPSKNFTAVDTGKPGIL